MVRRPGTVALTPPETAVVAGSLVSHSATALVCVTEEMTGPDIINGGVVSGPPRVVNVTLPVVGPLPDRSVADTVTV